MLVQYRGGLLCQYRQFQLHVAMRTVQLVAKTVLCGAGESLVVRLLMHVGCLGRRNASLVGLNSCGATVRPLDNYHFLTLRTYCSLTAVPLVPLA